MRDTTILEKAANSAINVAFVLLIFIPFWVFLDVSVLAKKIVFILLFFIYELSLVIFNKNVSVGMMITKSRWKKRYSIKNQLLHAALYTVSFSTMLFWIVFPFDLFLLNMAVQFIFLKLTGKTFHGYVSGGMSTVKRG